MAVDEFIILQIEVLFDSIMSITLETDGKSVKQWAFIFPFHTDSSYCKAFCPLRSMINMFLAS